MRFLYRLVKNFQKYTIPWVSIGGNETDLPVETRFWFYVVVHFLLLDIGGYTMDFKNAINIVHDIVITVFMVVGVIMMFCAEPIGAVIVLLAMIEDNLYKRR